MGYTIITENDTSQWNDETGAYYHYPSRYQKYLQPGTRVIYYKGKMKDKSFLNKRMTPEAHYFGTADVAKFYKDSKSDKNDFYCEIQNLFHLANRSFLKYGISILNIYRKVKRAITLEME